MSQPLGARVLFQTYVQRMADNAIVQIRAAGQGLPSEEARDLALNTLNYALSAPDIWPTASQLLTELAPKMEQAGHRQEWIEYLEAGIVQSQTRGDAKTEAELRLQLGVLWQLLAEFASARVQLGRSAELFAAQDDALGQARALNRLARSAARQGAFAEAEELANQAMALCDDEAEQAYSRLVLGVAALLGRKWAEAVRPLEISLTTWQKLGDKRMLAWTHTNLGSVYRRLDDYDEARRHLRQAIALFAEIGDPIHQARANVNLANTYLMRQEYEQALAYYFPAERIFRLVQDKRELANVYLGIGSTYRYMGHWPEAQQAYETSAAGWQELGDQAKAANAVNNIGLVYLAQGRCTEAIAQFERALHMLAQAKEAPEYADYLAEFSGHLARAQAEIA